MKSYIKTILAVFFLLYFILNPIIGLSQIEKVWESLNGPSISISPHLVDKVGNLYFNTALGLIQSSDQGNTINYLDLNLDIIFTYTLDPSSIILGTTGGIYWSSDNGSTLNEANPWVVYFGGQGSIAKNSMDELYVVTRTSVQGKLYKSVDKGQTWQIVFEPIQGYCLAIDANDYIYVGTDDDVVKSMDGGITWTSTELNDRVNSVNISPTNIVYARKSNLKGLFRSTDSGNNWEDLGFQDTEIEICVDSQDSIIVQSWDGTFASTNKGDSWFTINKSKGEHIPYLPIAAVTSTDVFRGSHSFGYFSSKDNGSSWNEILMNLPVVSVRHMVIDWNYPNKPDGKISYKKIVNCHDDTTKTKV